MTAEVIDGRKIAKALTADVALEVDQLSAEGIACGLATVAVGDDFSASAYQRRLERIANELGVPYRHVSLAAASQTRSRGSRHCGPRWIMRRQCPWNSPRPQPNSRGSPGN